MLNDVMNYTGPSYEELGVNEMMDIDGEVTTVLTWTPVAASSALCITGAAVSVIAYTVLS